MSGTMSPTRKTDSSEFSGHCWEVRPEMDPQQAEKQSYNVHRSSACFSYMDLHVTANAFLKLDLTSGSKPSYTVCQRNN